MTALLIIVALVIDLGFVRDNRQVEKSAADFAVAAGIRSMDNGAGQVQPWRGICAARDFLIANNDDLTGMTETYENGLGAAVSNPCSSPPVTVCADSPSPNASWGRLTGTANDGRISVTIQSGYDLSSSPFPEDSGAYSGDDGDGPCDHLVVIIEESEDAYFSGVAGVSENATRIRSVARLVRGNDPDITAALVLLEREDCLTLDVNGGASVRVSGAGDKPGAIHADSSGENCGSNEFIFTVTGSIPPPRIVSENATAADADGNIAPGQITAVALTPVPGAQPSKVSDGLDRVCAARSPSDCGDPSFGESPKGRDLVGRYVADVKYLEPIRNLRTRAQTRFDIATASDAIAAGYTPYGCNPAGPIAIDTAIAPGATGVWIDCSTTGGQTFDGRNRVFGSNLSNKEIVINGSLTISGSNNTMHLVDPSAVYVRGKNGDSVKLGNNNLFVNDGGLLDGASSGTADGFVCDDSAELRSSARTEFVVQKGRISLTQGIFRLCHTTVYLMDDSGTDRCPLPATVTKPGPAPYENDCKGNVAVAGDAAIDWTAPNQDDVNPPETSPIPNLLEQLEDLALWSETSGSWSVGGGGDVHLAGIFVAPNADPFTISGGGAMDVVDAQFVTRKLVATGGAHLQISPKPQNALQIPELRGFTLVR